MRISSIVFEARRDCWGGAGPDVLVVGAAPAVGPAVVVLAPPKRLGAAVVAVPAVDAAGCEGAAGVVAPKSEGAAVLVEAGCAAAELAWPPSEKPVKPAVGAAEVVVVLGCEDAAVDDWPRFWNRLDVVLAVDAGGCCPSPPNKFEV